MLDCHYQDMCELYCYLDVSYLWKALKDLYEDILELQSTSIALIYMNLSFKVEGPDT